MRHTITMASRLLMFISLFFIHLLAVANNSQPTVNMTEGVTRISRDIYSLHMTIFIVCCVIGAIVFGVIMYSIAHHRKSQGAVVADFHENTKLELLWTIIPFLILIVMAVPATRVLIDMKDASKPDLNIKVVGYQWKWQYQYLDLNIDFFSNLATPMDQINNEVPKDINYLLDVDNPMVIPIHKKIRVLVTSNDVIHSWWMPDFGVKRDAVPGYIHEAWMQVDKPGVYYGRCAELCGKDHGFMPVVVKAVTQIEFDKWVKEHKAEKVALAKAAKKVMTEQALMTKGKTEYDKYCAACHKVDGSGMPPAFPALQGSKVIDAPLAKHMDIVLNGVKGTAMQAFGAQLDDASIAAIITYERNAWGNDKVGANYQKTVQPKDVLQARSKK